MNILVIGNGFDIEHNLPTRYSEFLHYLLVCKHIYEGHRENKSTKKMKETLDFDISHRWGEWSFCNEIKERLIEFIDDYWILSNLPVFSMLATNSYNMWMEYFIQRCSENFSVDNKWIDFEAEMTKIIQRVDNMASNITETKHSIDVDELLLKDNPLIELMKDDEADSFTGNVGRFIQAVNDEFKYFLESLHEYIFYIDTRVELKFKSPTIEKLKIDKVFNFNYTDTYRRVYDDKMLDDNICFIHGNVKPHNDRHSIPIVLGGNQKADMQSPCYGITKESQRIANHTDYSYKDWFKNKKKKHNLYIFGHSLGEADIERLYELIKECDSVTIYHFGKNEQNLINNYRNNIYMKQGLNNEFDSFEEYCRIKNVNFELQEKRIGIKRK